MTWDLVVDLQIVEALSLVQGIHVGDAAPLFTEEEVVVCARCVLLPRASVTAVVFISWVAVRIVDKALLLKEVFPASFAGFINLLAASKSVILDVDLALGSRLLELLFRVVVALNVLLEHTYQADQLAALHLLRVKIVRFSYVQVRDHIVS